MANPASSELAVEAMKCESCGFTEDCTPAYISCIREKHSGRWICGLCSEVVKNEVLKSDMIVTTEEALKKHIHFCQEFQCSTSNSGQIDYPISAIGRLFRRSLDCPRTSPLCSSTTMPANVIRRRRPVKLLRSD